MEEGAGIQEWELLHSLSGTPDSRAVDAFLGIEGDAEGAVKSDYFSLGSVERYAQRSPSDGEGEGGSLPDSDNPSWVDPASESRFLGEPSRGDPGGFWTSDESSDGQESSEVVLEGVDSNTVQGLGGSDAGEIGAAAAVESGSVESGGLRDVGPEERSDVGNFTASGGKAGWAWWKLPVELLKFCVFRIKPVWSVSIAAALLAVVMLGRRLWKKKPKMKKLPLKVSVDEKKASQFIVRASRINEAFSVVKRVPPMIRSTFPTQGVTPWPAVALR